MHQMDVEFDRELPWKLLRVNKAHLCYTVLALSDLAVSGSEPSKASLPGTVFPKPLQRIHMSLPSWGPLPWVKPGPAVYCAFVSDRKSTRLNSSHLGISYAV